MDTARRASGRWLAWAARRPHVLAMVCILVLGSLYAMTIVPFGGVDEIAHFMHSWEVSNGYVFGETMHRSSGTILGENVPAALPTQVTQLYREGPLQVPNAQHVWSHLRDPAPGGKLLFDPFQRNTTYPPVTYLPAAAAIRVGRMLGASTLMMLLMARLAGVAAFSLIVGLAVKRIPTRRWLLVLLALTPAVLFRVATVSDEALTLALAMLLIAEVLHLLSIDSERISRSLLWEVGGATAALALAKPPTFLIAVLLLLPAWKHRTRAGAVLGATCVLSCTAAIAWARWAAAKFTPGEVAHGRGVDTAQLSFVRHHPLSFLHVVGSTVSTYGGSLVHDVVAQTAWYRVPNPVVALVFVILIIGVVTDAGPIPATRAVQVTAALIAAVLVIATLVVAYVGWNG